MKRILLIHPEGNINNNPSLSGLAEILSEAGFDLHVVSPRIPGRYQQPPIPGVAMHLFEGLDKAHITGRIFADSGGAGPVLSAFVDRFGPFHLVVGVDRGVIDAARVAQVCSIPHALISYEIFFRDEAGADFKQAEIDACRGLAFAVCQDTVRAQHLSVENGIPRGRIIFLPVAGRGARPGPKTDYLHDHLGIPRHQRIALFAGSVSEMCGISAVIRQAASWPERWALVIHNRYGVTPSVRKYWDACRGVRNIHFSTEPCDDIRGMGRLLHSADLGLAFYQTVAGSIYTGKNVGDIGMSSGKIATYLQHGLPVVTNSVGLMSRLIEHHRLGWVMDLDRVDLAAIQDRHLDAWRANCLRFFEEKLDLNLTAAALVAEVKRAVHDIAAGATGRADCFGPGKKPIPEPTAIVQTNGRSEALHPDSVVGPRGGLRC